MNNAPIFLSQHFTLRELCKTQQPYSNVPSAAEVVSLTYLCQALENVRQTCGGRPIYVSSGYRSEKVNKAVGGVEGSQHLRGEAVDFSFGSIMENRRQFEVISQRCDYDQLILERSGRWIHLSYVPPFLRPNRQQVLYT